uniref:Uncharacterized protein n=1 Tax=Anguilla anguilla TaxID=7936 RepID=A0A0E9PL85_ANGAN
MGQTYSVLSIYLFIYRQYLFYNLYLARLFKTLIFNGGLCKPNCLYVDRRSIGLANINL